MCGIEGEGWSDKTFLIVNRGFRGSRSKTGVDRAENGLTSQEVWARPGFSIFVGWGVVVNVFNELEMYLENCYSSEWRESDALASLLTGFVLR